MAKIISSLPGSGAGVLSRTSQLINDGSDNTSTYVETDELGTAAFSNDYNDLDNLPIIGNGITNLDYTSSPTNGIVTSDTGTDATIPLADAVNAGLISAAEKTRIASELVPYTGATTNVDLGEYQLKTGQLEFDQTPTGTFTTGKVRWNDSDGTIELMLKGGNVTLQIGQEQLTRVVNKTGVTLLESEYKAVYISGAQGNRLKCGLAIANNDIFSNSTLGLVTENINNNTEGFVTSSGLVRGINTTGSLQGETWLEGDVLYLSPTTPGQLTNIAPIAPDHLTMIGYVVNLHTTQGSIYVKVQIGYGLNELHNVLINTPLNNNVLTYETSTNLWNNKSIPATLGYTPENVSNKQNSLAIDGTGTKYPTVDAINTLKWIKSNESLSLAQRKGDVLYGILDQYTGEEITLSKVTGTPTVDGIIYFQLGTEYFKRNYGDYADARWFGAKGDGIDLGIGNYTGDQEEINKALTVCKKVILKNGTFLVKKPIVLNDENDLFIDVTATLKLGDASNCTLLKNSHVDIYKDGNGVPTYPVGFVRHKNIKVHGKGLIDFNGWMQNRADDTSASQDNPAVIGTPRFADGLGIGNYYVGWGAKFVDIDNFFFGGGLTVKNARTYTFSCSGLTNYLFDGIISERNYFVQNQDFLNLVGSMYDGIVRNIYGVSGDEFIVISNNQLGDLTLRQGDVKRLLIENITYFGIDPTATPTNQKPMPTFEDGFNSHRLARISYTKSFVVDDITIQNCNATNSKLHAQIVISKLPYSGGVTVPDMFAGDGYIGKVTLDNVNCPNQQGFLDFGDYTIVRNLVINNIIDRRVGNIDPRSFIANYENFTGETIDFTNSKIENLTLNNVKTILGGGSNPSKSWITFAGEIKNLTIDSYAIVTEAGSETDVFWNFLESNLKNLWVSNSDFSRFNKIFNLSNVNCFFFENNSTYKNPKDTETQIFERANTSTFVIDTDNITNPDNGDVVRMGDGLKLFNGTFWQNFNKPLLTTGIIPVQGLDDLEDSKLNISGGGYDYNFGNSTNTVNVNIHKAAGFFGDTTPFTANYYDGFNLFRSYMDGDFNTIFESLQRGAEQSGFIFRVNSINSLDLRKDGNAYFNGIVNATSYTGSANLTGTPTAPTAAPGTNNEQIANMAAVQTSTASVASAVYGSDVSLSSGQSPYTLQLSDANARLTTNGNFNQNYSIVIPTNAVIPFQIGTKIRINTSTSPGYTTLSGVGVTFLGANLQLRYGGSFNLTKVATNTWFVEHANILQINGSGNRIVTTGDSAFSGGFEGSFNGTFSGTLGVSSFGTYTVATLPVIVSGTAYATVSDATAPTYLGTLIGGGSVVCPVFYNGTAWVSH